MSYSDCNSHTCTLATSSVRQSFDELEFERGIWSAAQYGELDKVQKLVRQGTGVDKRDSGGYTALHYAARNGKLEVCKYLVNNGADVNAVTRAGGATALHRAALAGQVEVVKYLLENNANYLLLDIDNKTALHRAAESQNIKICQLLIAKGPSMKVQVDNRGKVPVDYALSENLISILSG